MAKPTKNKGRKASQALYVLLEPEEHERYKSLADRLGISLRDLVRTSMNEYASRMNDARRDMAERIERITAMIDEASIEGRQVVPELTDEERARAAAVTADLRRQSDLANVDIDARTRVTALEEQVRELAQWKRKVEPWVIAVGGKLGMNP